MIPAVRVLLTTDHRPPVVATGLTVMIEASIQWMEFMRASRAFTLIELLVTVAVLAIVLTIAVPSFTSTIRSNRTTNTVNEISLAVQLARTEALKRRLPVILCASNQAASDCQSSDDWSSGWLVRQVSGDVIRVWDSQNGVTVQGPSAGVTFDANGMTTLAAGTSVNLSVAAQNCTNEKSYTLNLLRTGNLTSTSTSCSASQP